jgi:glycosyltransferase involved in cell wall biosynthesis
VKHSPPQTDDQRERPIDISSDFRVSVVIPLFNKAPYIRRTLQSVLDQTRPADEVIIVDDGSTDGSVNCIHDLIGGTVKFVAQDNAGPGPARNRGIAEASQPWVAFVDADDVWFRNHLATLAELSARFPEADAVATAYQVSAAGNSIEFSIDGHSELRASLLNYFEDAAGRERICTSCVAVKRSTLHVGGFDAFWPGEDLEMWTRLALDHDIAVTEACTAVYVRGTGGLMDKYESSADMGFRRQPVFATLERALSDPRYAERADAIRTYRNFLLKQNVKQALYRRDPVAARAYVAELDRSGRSQLGMLRLLSWLPGPILYAGIVTRSLLLKRRR